MQEKESKMVVRCRLKILSLGITVRRLTMTCRASWCWTVTLMTVFSIHASQPLKILILLNLLIVCLSVHLRPSISISNVSNFGWVFFQLCVDYLLWDCEFSIELWPFSDVNSSFLLSFFRTICWMDFDQILYAFHHYWQDLAWDWKWVNIVTVNYLIFTCSLYHDFVVMN